MLNEFIEYVYDYDIVKIIDTDSVFVKLPESIVSKSKSDILQCIKEIEDYINSEMELFCRMHNGNKTDIVNMRLKNEFYVDKILSYSKKRYIASSSNIRTGEKNLEVRGVEGRRSAAQYIVDFVKEIENFISGQTHNKEYFPNEDTIDLEKIIYDIWKKIEEAVLNYDFKYIGIPLNPPQVSFDKLKNIGSGTRGMFVYNVFFDEFFGLSYSKSFHIPICISLRSLENNTELVDYCRKIINKFSQFDVIKIKMKKKNYTENMLFIDYIKDLTIPEMAIEMNHIKNFLKKYGIVINIHELLMKFAKKVHVLCQPFYASFGFDYIQVIGKLCNYVNKYYNFS